MGSPPGLPTRDRAKQLAVRLVAPHRIPSCVAGPRQPQSPIWPGPLPPLLRAVITLDFLNKVTFPPTAGLPHPSSQGDFKAVGSAPLPNKSSLLETLASCRCCAPDT